MALLTLLVVTVAGLMRLRSLTSVVILNGAYSFLLATAMVALDAPDVAMTEAAIGAGVSTVLLLAAIALTGTKEAAPQRIAVAPIFVSIATAAVLIWGAVDLPDFGAGDSAPNTHVAPYYLDNSLAQTQSPNVVTAVLASYRGFDTLGEVIVILTAGLGVLVLIGGTRSREARVLEPDLMIRVATKMLVPFILLFAFYVLLHGEYGPGGGFQAGAAAASAIVLYALIFGLARVERAAPPLAMHVMMAAGALIFTGTGVASLTLGAEYLNYSALGADAPAGQKLGILIIETGVFLTVTGTLVAIYYALAGRRHV